MTCTRNTILCLATLALAAAPVLAQQAPVEGPLPTGALIHVTTKHDATLDPSLLHLQVNRHDAPITAITPIAPAATEVAILIDSGLRQSFDLQLEDIRSFVRTLPPNTKVLIGYMENGEVRGPGTFTADHEEVLSALHIPISVAGIDASPYFSLSNFVKHWPSNQRASRFVLLVTNGVDPYNGSPSVLNQDSPYVQSAQDDAQRAGVAVYSIYYPQSGMRGGSFSGQSYLQQVGEATGAESLYFGTITPVSLAPYLSMFSKAIHESYTVDFLASPGRGKRDTLTQIKLTTSQPGVKIYAPQSVHPGITQ